MSKSGLARLLLVAVVLAIIAGPATAQITVRAYLETNDYNLGIDSIRFYFTTGRPATIVTGWGGVAHKSDSMDLVLTAHPDSSVMLFPFLEGVPFHPQLIPVLVTDSWYNIPPPPGQDPVESRIKFTVLVGVEEPGTRTPDAPAFARIAPNPFSLTTEVAFANPVAQDLELAIFNAAGSRVKTLGNGRFAAGSYRLNWNGTDDRNQGIENGIYFCRLLAGETALTRKLILSR